MHVYTAVMHECLLCSVQCCTVLHHTVPCCAVLAWAGLGCNVLFDIAPVFQEDIVAKTLASLTRFGCMPLSAVKNYVYNA